MAISIAFIETSMCIYLVKYVNTYHRKVVLKASLLQEHRSSESLAIYPAFIYYCPSLMWLSVYLLHIEKMLASVT